MTEEWLIDGYNLLHGLDSQGGPPKKTRNLQDVLAWIADFASQENHRVCVVLDGRGAQDELEIFHTAYFRVVYSQKISADAVIEKQLYDERSIKSFVVVTNDRAIANIARGGGARVLSVAQFADYVNQSKNESKEIIAKKKVTAHGFHRPFDDKLKKFE